MCDKNHTYGKTEKVTFPSDKTFEVGGLVFFNTQVAGEKFGLSAV